MISVGDRVKEPKGTEGIVLEVFERDGQPYVRVDLSGVHGLYPADQLVPVSDAPVTTDSVEEEEE